MTSGAGGFVKPGGGFDKSGMRKFGGGSAKFDEFEFCCMLNRLGGGSGFCNAEKKS